MEKYKIESLLDSKRFGFKVGKTNGLIFKENPELVINELKKYGYKLIISRVDMSSIDLVNKMENVGFRVKDTQITYKHDLKFIENEINFFNDSLNIRDYKKSDIDRLIQITKESFNNYGHYFLNNKLNKQKCLEVYEDWVYNTCTNTDIADKILIYQIDGDPKGFLSFKIYNDNEKIYAAGGIGAVDINYRGKNIFPHILFEGLKWGNSVGLDWQEHNVIVNNYPVNRSMNKLGFKPSNLVTTMHCWLN